jgi:hypothetical protein
MNSNTKINSTNQLFNILKRLCDGPTVRLAINNIRAMLELIGNKEIITAPMADGISMFDAACAFGKFHLVTVLAEYFYVNSAYDAGRTPLHYAVANNHVRIAEFLIYNCNANTNIADANGNTPLHIAAKNALKRMTRLLLENQADSSAKNNDGNTPIIFVVDESMSKRATAVFDLIDRSDRELAAITLERRNRRKAADDEIYRDYKSLPDNVQVKFLETLTIEQFKKLKSVIGNDL